MERLRYAEAQAQADVLPKPENIARTLSRKLITSRSIYKSRQSAQLSEQKQPYSMSLSQSGSVYTLANVTPEDALWFSRLPDKIKRGYFSLEEEKLLSAKKEELALGTTEESLYDLGEILNQSLPSLQNPSSYLSSVDDSTSYSVFSDDDDEDEEEEEEEDGDEEEDDDDNDMDIELTSTLGWLDTDLDLSLDDYHQILTDPRSSNTAVPRSSSVYEPERSPTIEQSLSILEIDEQPHQGYAHTLQPLTAIRKRRSDRWETQWIPNSIPPVPPVPEAATIQTLLTQKASVVSIVNPSSRMGSRNSTGPTSPFKEDQSSMTKNENKPAPIWVPGPTKPPTPPMTPSFSVADSQATHYLDPEARLKLRMYLASASKFDEAIEFGFPSLPSPDKSDATFLRPVSAIPSSYHSVKQHRQSRPTTSTFKSCNAGTSTTASPVSAFHPSLPESEFLAIPYNSISDNCSDTMQERKTEVQAQLRKVDRDLEGCAAGREMTIRMTLTRPELRADESLLYPHMHDFSSGGPGLSSKTDDSWGLQDLKLSNELLRPVTSRSEKTSSLRRLLSRKTILSNQP